jgi:penicillin amidase
MRIVGKVFRYLLLALLVTVTVIVAALWIAGRNSVPDLSGERSLAGLGAEVRILSDEHAIPTIRAESMTDAYRALGYLHARDRMWQMETMRRIGAGRLAEVVGPPMAPYDELMRALGLYRQAEAQTQRLSEGERGDLQAYADGVNAYLETRDVPLPIEFQLTRHAPEPWTIADSLVWGRLMSVQLSGDAFREAQRAALLEMLGPERLAEFRPRNDKTPTTLNAENRDSWITGYDASNAWVLSGERTATGKPILANDPHLGLNMPNQWYLARIETPELTLAGATAPGVPLHVLGHNGRIAWGMTTTYADTQDSVVLNQEAYNGAEIREETIRVRFGRDRTVEIRETAYGPVLARLGSDPTAMQWTASRVPGQTARALYRLNRAGDWNEFRDALSFFDDPAQNIFYADTDGRIGMQVTGTLPRRAEGVTGALPLHAGRGEAAWLGLVPPSEMPAAVDPETGMLYNANNRIVSEDYPYSISHTHEPSYRLVRLREMLDESAEGHTLEDSAAIQTDVLSDAARRLVPEFVKTIPPTPLAEDALALLGGWDYRMTRDAAAPAIYMTMLNELIRVLAEDDLGAETFPEFWRTQAEFAELVLSDATHWCDDVRTDPAEDCGWALATALERAVFVLADEQGDTAGEWRWGEAHTAPMRNRLLDLVPGLGGLGNAPLETPGGDHTLNRGQSWGGDGAGAEFSHVHGAGFRAIYDLDDLDRSLYALAGGQSGNPFSDHYEDLLTDWRDGRYFRIPGRVGDIPPEGGALLILRP